MKTLEEFVDAKLNMDSAEAEFKKELCNILKIDESNIKTIDLNIDKTAIFVVHKVIISLVGSNTFASKDVAKIEGLSIVTPNRLEIEVSVISL